MPTAVGWAGAVWHVGAAGTVGAGGVQMRRCACWKRRGCGMYSESNVIEFYSLLAGVLLEGVRGWWLGPAAGMVVWTGSSDTGCKLLRIPASWCHFSFLFERCHSSPLFGSCQSTQTHARTARTHTRRCVIYLGRWKALACPWLVGQMHPAQLVFFLFIHARGRYIVLWYVVLCCGKCCGK